MGYVFEETSGVPLKMWTSGVQVEETAKQQLRNVASMPFIYRHVAVMPDVHWGRGATVGSVIATKGAIIPAAVGVDIGCGMCAWRLSLNASQLPDSLHNLRSKIEAAVPHGRTDNGGKNDRGAWGVTPNQIIDRWATLSDQYARIIAKHPGAKSHNNANHLGSLGTGNHFIEIMLIRLTHTTAEAY